MLVEESPAPHYITVEDSPAPQFIAVEESPVPMSGVKNRPCLVLESPEPTEDRAGTTSPVPMSGTKDRPSLVDDSPAMPKVNNLCWGGGNAVEGGSATLPINLVSPPTNTSPTEDPQLPNWGGDPEIATRSGPVFASHPRTQSPMVVHESPQYIVVDASPSPPPRPNTVGPFPPPPSPRHRQVAYIKHVQGIPHLVRPSNCGGSGGGDIPLVGGRQHLLLRARHPRPALRGGPLVPPWQGGLLGGAVVGHLHLRRGGSILSTFWGPHSYTGGGRPTAHLWPSPVCGALRNGHPISDGTGEGPANSESRVAAIPSGTSSGSSLYRGHQSVLRGPDDPNLVYIGYICAAVQGYRRDSKVVEASVADHLKMSNGNTAKCFSAVESLATRYVAVASRIDVWDHRYSTPAEPVTVVLPPPSAPPPVPDPTPAAPTAPMGAPPQSSGGGCVLPFSVHPSHDCIYHPNACRDSGWLRGGGEHHEHPHPQ